MTLPEPTPVLAGIHRTREAGHERQGLVGLDRNERVAPLPEWFLAALRERLTSRRISDYPAVDELQTDLAAATGLEQDRLLVTGGSDPAVRLACHAFLRPDDTVAMLDPSYAMYPIYARMYGAEVAAAAFDRTLAPDLDALFAAVPRARLALIANPNQPTGTVLDEKILRELLGIAAAAGTLTIVDEAYYPFSGTTVLDWTRDYPNLVVLRTFSKAAGLAGLRVGFAAGAPEVLAAMYKVRSAAEVNAAGVEAARLALAHPDLALDYVAEVGSGRALLEERAKELGLEPLPSRTNFLLLRVGAVVTPAALVAALRDRGFLVRGPFASGCLDDCIRVTLGPPELMSRFADALADALADEGQRARSATA